MPFGLCNAPVTFERYVNGNRVDGSILGHLFSISMVFVREFVSRFGVPLQLHSDEERNFESVLFKTL